MFPWYLLIFLKISLVFPIPLFSSISLQGSLILSLLAILWNSAFSWVYIFSFLLCLSLPFFWQLFVKSSSDSHFVFLHFFVFLVGGSSKQVEYIDCQLMIRVVKNKQEGGWVWGLENCYFKKAQGLFYPRRWHLSRDLKEVRDRATHRKLEELLGEGVF